MKALFKPLLCVIAVLILTSCSAIKLVYDRAPKLAANAFDDAFDLNRDQRKQLDARLKLFFKWHRQNELPRYRQFLTEVSSEVTEGLTAAEIIRLSQQAREARDRAMAKAIELVGDLASSISPAQIEHFKQTYQQQRAEHDEDRAKSPEAQAEKRAKRRLKRIEHWTGSFSAKEEKRIIARLMQLPAAHTTWDDYRDARHQAMVEILSKASNSGNPENTQQQLRELLLDREHRLNQPMQPVRQRSLQAWGKAAEEISSWLTEKQKQKAVAKLKKYASVIAEIENQ